MAKTKNEKIQELIEWFKTYDCEDTDEVIDKWLSFSDNAIDKPKLTKQELNQELTDYFNKYRKAQGLPLLDVDGNEIRE